MPQMMKAYLTMMVYRKSISPDSLAVDVKGLEEWAASPQTEVQDRAVLYSILGGEVDDFDMSNEYLRLSLKDSLKLVDYPAEKLVPMVKTGETSRLYFDNNLYDLLARRAIGLWNRIVYIPLMGTARESIQQTYQSLLHIYKVRNMRSAWLLTALDAYPQVDESQLRAWMVEYADIDVCAEVYLRLAERMQQEDEPAKRLALLREGIKRYPHYNRINALKNEEKEILAPRLGFWTQYAYPGEPIELKTEHCNLQGFTMKLYRLSLSAESDALAKVGPKTVTKYGKLIGEEHFDLLPTPDYRLRRDTLKMKPLEVGIYYAVAVPDGHQNAIRGALVYVSSLQVLHRALPEERQEMVVAGFVTEKKTEELLHKVAKLAGSKKGEVLKENIAKFSTVKSINESIYYSIDKIISAVEDGCKIGFNYFDYDLRRGKSFRKSKEEPLKDKWYVVNPVATVFDDDQYYLICYDDKHEGLANYRVDRMDRVQILDEKITPNPDIENIDLAERQRQMFGMFSGEIKTVTFEADRGLIDVIFDKFGNGVEIFRTDKEKIHCKVEVQAGPMFIAWCCSFDNRLRVTTPPSVVKMVKDHLTKTLEQYK